MTLHLEVWYNFLHGGRNMNDRKYYYIRNKRKIDGNDVGWLTQDGEITFDLRNAGLFSFDETRVFQSSKDHEIHEAHIIQRLIQFHVPLSKIKRFKAKAGEKHYMICTRDTCGKNATFWCWDHHGYSSEVRNAQVFPYKEKTGRSIDVLVPVKEVQKRIEHRIDIQDLRDERNLTHVLQREYFNE